jgi:hypothetical protein
VYEVRHAFSLQGISLSSHITDERGALFCDLKNWQQASSGITVNILAYLNLSFHAVIRLQMMSLLCVNLLKVASQLAAEPSIFFFFL